MTHTPEGTPTLEPCPCCGSPDIIPPDHEEAPVYCKTCWLRAVNLAAWNRRILSRRVEELEAENARLRKMTEPEWFYLAGDMSSDRCRFSVWEVIDEDWLWDNRAEGSAVVQIEAATRCPDIWALIRFFTNEEKDARQSDDAYEITEYASEEEARAALQEKNDA